MSQETVQKLANGLGELCSGEALPEVVQACLYVLVSGLEQCKNNDFLIFTATSFEHIAAQLREMAGPKIILLEK